MFDDDFAGRVEQLIFLGVFVFVFVCICTPSFLEFVWNARRWLCEQSGAVDLCECRPKRARRAADAPRWNCFENLALVFLPPIFHKENCIFWQTRKSWLSKVYVIILHFFSGKIRWRSQHGLSRHWLDAGNGVSDKQLPKKMLRMGMSS